MIIIRGLRAVSDFEYEYPDGADEPASAPEMETVFMVPSLDTTYISSSLVREVARFTARPTEPRASDRRGRRCATKFPKA